MKKPHNLWGFIFLPMNNLYLAHHGVKGQKWGVRNGPPYPIEDKVLRKGTKLNSVSSTYANSEAYKNNGRPMYMYNPEDEWDTKVYEGPFPMYLAMYRGARFVKVHQYEVVEDLNMPTKAERVQEFKNLFENKKDKKDVLNDITSIQKQLVMYKIGNEKEQEAYKNFNPNSIKTAEDWNTAYSIFNHAMEASYAHKSTTTYMNQMKRKYDAMVDDNNQGVYNNAHDPIVIFNAQKVLKTVEDYPIRYLTTAEITQNRNAVAEELAKEGKKVKL